MRPVPILMYHSVAELTNPAYDRWCVSVPRFQEQMSILDRNRYAVLTTGDYVNRLGAGAALPEKFVVVTFDDGLRDFKTGAFPILQRFGFPATLYVVAGRVGLSSKWLAPEGEGRRRMLTSDEVRFLHRSGIEIGSHTMTHPELDILDHRAAQGEIHGSRRVLEEIIGAPVSSFAYPHGYNSAETRRIVEMAAYRSAVRVRHAHSAPEECRFGLSRLIVTDDLEEERFLALIERPGRLVAPPQDRLIGRLWRSARRLRRWRDAGRRVG